MIRIEKVPNVYNFGIYKNSLILKTEDKLIDYYNEKVLENNIELFSIIDSKLFIKKKGELVFFQEEIKIVLNGTFNPKKAVFFNDFFIQLGKVKKEKKTIKVNLRNSQISTINIEPYYPSLSYKNYALKIANFIELYDPFNGKSFWKREFKDLLHNENASIYGNTQVIGNRLFFFLFDRSRTTADKSTYCLNAETGQILWQSDEFGGWLTKFDDRIYSVFDKTVQILNPMTFNVEKIDLTNCLSVLDKEIYFNPDNKNYKKTFFLSSARYQIEKSNLFFTEDRGSTFGVVNLQTKELIDYKELEIKNEDVKSIGVIKIDSKMIYVSDSDYTLHIFNKPKNTFANKV